MSRSFAFVAVGLISAVSIGTLFPAYAQAPTKSAPAQRPAQAPVSQSAAPPAALAPTADPQDAGKQNMLAGRWSSRCTSEGRTATLDCVVEQSAVMTQTGQLLLAVTVRVPADTRQPVMMIHGPVGLFLPAGITIQIDDGKPQQIPLQTCDQKGCYAGMPVSTELIGAMKTGKRFAVSFQNMAKENIAVPFALTNFAEAYQKIQ